MTSNEEEMNNDMGDVTPQDEGGPSLSEDDQNRPSVAKAIIMMVVCTGTMKIKNFAKYPQAFAGGTGFI